MRLAGSPSSSRDGGFTIVEVLVALLIIAVMALGTAQLFAVSIRATYAARNQTSTTVLAAQKMEQLRSLTWGFDTIGLPLTDLSTNTALPIPSPTGGRGLQPSPPESLRSNTDGYVDYIDGFGRTIGGGADVPGGAVYIRRWSVEPLPTNPNNTLILQVLVTKLRDRGTADSQFRSAIPASVRRSASSGPTRTAFRAESRATTKRGAAAARASPRR